VLGLEVSRLARNSTDWHRLLEICALTDTLILDEDGLYDPRHFNDRLKNRVPGGFLTRMRADSMLTALLDYPASVSLIC
jgi:DNA invertase Pin-like site-specific DNA recombinase